MSANPAEMARKSGHLLAAAARFNIFIRDISVQDNRADVRGKTRIPERCLDLIFVR